MSNSETRVLIIEDSNKKFEAIYACVIDINTDAIIIRASTMTEAEEKILDGPWDLIVLDISMDIASSLQGSRARGQANVGGLGIAQKMFLINREAPTIIVTAFDSFTSPNTRYGRGEVLGFEEVRSRAAEYLGDFLVDCLQYNSANWKSSMREAVKMVTKK